MLHNGMKRILACCIKYKLILKVTLQLLQGCLKDLIEKVKFPQMDPLQSRWIATLFC